MSCAMASMPGKCDTVAFWALMRPHQAPWRLAITTSAGGSRVGHGQAALVRVDAGLRIVAGCERLVTVEIRHKGLRQFALTGSRRGVPAAMASKLRRILSDLESAGSPTDLPAPAYRG